MSKRQEALRKLALGLSQRDVCRSVKISSATIVQLKKFCRERNISFLEASKLSDEELMGKRKEVKETGARRPDFEYIHSELKRKGVTLKLLHDEYVEECLITGKDYLKYTQFCNVYKEYVEDNILVMHIERKPGERIEVDWAGTTIPVYNHTQSEVIDKAYLFVGVLPFSQYMYAAASLNMREEAWINHHVEMFRYFGGAATILQCDNLKTGVIAHKKYDEIIYNRAYQEMCEYYDTAVIACRVRAPRDKNSSEATVGFLTNNIIGKLRNYKFTSVFEINEKIKEELYILNNQSFQKRDYSRSYVFENEEKAYLKPLPVKPYEYAYWKKAVVGLNYHVSVDFNYYSVPYTYLRKEVDLRISQYMIEIFDGNQRIVSHPRILSCKGKYVTLEEHMPENHKAYGNWDKDRIVEWSKTIGESTYQVISSIFANARFEVQVYNQCITILKLADKYSKEVLEKACEYLIRKNITPIHKNFMIVIDSIQNSTRNKERKNEGAILRGASYYSKKS